MDTKNIKTAEPFKDLFPIDLTTLGSIEESMQDEGFVAAHPITIWKEGGVVIDGHTRLSAALHVGFEDVPVYEMSFPNEDAALEWAIHCQRDRRNMTDGDLMRCIMAVDKRKRPGERTDLKEDLGASEPRLRSAQQTAQIVGTSDTKVKKARTIIDHAPEPVKQAVQSGKMSIHSAYQETQAARKPQAPVNIPVPDPDSVGVNDPMVTFFARISLRQSTLKAFHELAESKGRDPQEWANDTLKRLVAGKIEW